MSASSRILWILCVLEAAVALPAALPAGSGERPPPGSAALAPAFVENRGQWPEHVRFASVGSDLVAAVRRDGLAIAAGPLELTFEGARGDVEIEGEGEPAGTYTFIHGRDRSRWRSGARGYRSILWRGIHDCIDLRLREGPPEDGRRTLEYDLILEPGADPGAIAIRCDGAEGLALEEDGSLAIATPVGVLRQLAPRTWQELPSGERIPVACRLAILDERRFGFEVAPADPSLPLTIDPPLVWATYLGGSHIDGITTVAFDRDGGVVVAGVTRSVDFPESSTPLRGDLDGFVAKLSPDGSRLEWAVLLGGTVSSLVGWDSDDPMALAVDEQGMVTVGGWTWSPDFPIEAAIQDELAGLRDGFLMRLLPDPERPGEVRILSSTFLGGSGDDAVTDLEVDSAGRIVACGFTGSADFPVTPKPGAYQETFGGGSCDAWVARIVTDPAGLTADRLEYATFLGGAGEEAYDGVYDRLVRQALDLEPSGVVTVTGVTFSPDFPTTEGAYSRTLRPADHDIYVTRLIPDSRLAPAEQLLYSTLLGGSSNDIPNDVLVDDEGTTTVVGLTWSADFPTTAGAFDRVHGGDYDAFVARLKPDAGLPPAEQLVYSTLLGVAGFDEVRAVQAGGPETVFIAGATLSKDFPVTAGAIQVTFSGEYGSFLACLRLDGTVPADEQLLYSTLFAHSYAFDMAADGNGGVAVGGFAWAWPGEGFPVTPGAFQTEPRGSQDAFVARLDLRLPTAEIASSQDGASVCVDGSASSSPEGSTIESWAWDFGDGEADQGRTPSCHVYDCPGIYPITLTVTNSLGLVATTSRAVTVRCDEGDGVAAPWTAADIGAPRFRGSASQDGDCIAICAGGLLLDFSGRADDLHFVEKEIAGDFSLVLRIEEMGCASLGEQPGGQLGLMARETLDPASVFAAVSIRQVGSGSPEFRWNSRAASEATVRSRSCLDADCPAAGVPGWVRLERKGDDLTGSVSADGRTWKAPQEWKLSLPGAPAPAALRVGIFGTSREPIDVRRAFEALRARACLEDPAAEPGFIRGDCNQDGKVDISDAVCILEWLFLGGEASTCAAAADANDDGAVNISDPISLLGYLFLGGAPPAAPFPGCGAGAGCESFAGCR